MSRSRHGVAWVVLAGAAVLAAPSGLARGNGDVQREIQGRVVSVDARTATLVVAREFRGKTTPLTLHAGPGTRVFACGEARATLEGIRTGAIVSVFYEVLGTEGVANIVVLEPGR